MHDGVDITGVLLERLRDVATRPLPADSVGQAIAAAIAPDMRSRGWKLVALAASLRRAGDQELALALLDAVVALTPPDDVSHAAYTTAIAIHTDHGDYETATKLGKHSSGSMLTSTC